MDERVVVVGGGRTAGCGSWVMDVVVVFLGFSFSLLLFTFVCFGLV